MLNIWLTLIVIIFIVYILRLVAKKVVELRNVISWLILCLPVIWFPNLIGQVSKMLGIQVPSNLIFFLGFCLLVYLNFSLTRITSKQSVQIRQLSQKIALQVKEHEE